MFLQKPAGTEQFAAAQYLSLIKKHKGQTVSAGGGLSTTSDIHAATALNILLNQISAFGGLCWENTKDVLLTAGGQRKM